VILSQERLVWQLRAFGMTWAMSHLRAFVANQVLSRIRAFLGVFCPDFYSDIEDFTQILCRYLSKISAAGTSASVFLNAGRLTFPNVPSQWAIGSRLTRRILLENSWRVLPLNLTIHLEI